MTRDQVLTHLCQTVGLVYRSIGNYTNTSDGFCPSCSAQHDAAWSFRHDGETLEYVRRAVIETLQRDGIKLDAASLAEMEARS